MLHEQLEDYSNEYLAALIRYAQGIIDERESLIDAASISPRHGGTVPLSNPLIGFPAYDKAIAEKNERDSR